MEIPGHTIKVLRKTPLAIAGFPIYTQSMKSKNLPVHIKDKCDAMVLDYLQAKRLVFRIGGFVVYE